MSNLIDALQFGPYSEQDAEVVAERLLDSKEYRAALESLLRCDTTIEQFMTAMQFAAESIYASWKEEELENARDRRSEVYEEEAVEWHA